MSRSRLCHVSVLWAKGLMNRPHCCARGPDTHGNVRHLGSHVPRNTWCACTSGARGVHSLHAAQTMGDTARVCTVYSIVLARCNAWVRAVTRRSCSVCWYLCTACTGRRAQLRDTYRRVITTAALNTLPTNAPRRSTQPRQHDNSMYPARARGRCTARRTTRKNAKQGAARGPRRGPFLGQQQPQTQQEMESSGSSSWRSVCWSRRGRPGYTGPPPGAHVSSSHEARVHSQAERAAAADWSATADGVRAAAREPTAPT